MIPGSSQDRPKQPGLGVPGRRRPPGSLDEEQCVRPRQQMVLIEGRGTEPLPQQPMYSAAVRAVLLLELVWGRAVAGVC